MQERALFVLIPEYADWEPALLAAGLRRGFGLFTRHFDVAIAAPTLEPVSSIGGFRNCPTAPLPMPRTILLR